MATDVEKGVRAGRRTALLLVTGACNLKCKYCYEGHKRNLKMEHETARRIVDDELNRESEEEVEFVYMGGEPLLAFDVIRATTEWAWSKWRNRRKFRFSMRTNGTLLTPEIAEWLREHRALVKVGLSLDGIQAVQSGNRGTSEDDIDVRFFVENWPDMGIKATIFKDSVAFLHQSVISFAESGYLAHFAIGEGMHWDAAAVKTLADEYAKIVEYALEHPEWTNFDGVFTMKPELFYPDAPMEELPYCGLSNGIVAYWMTGEAYSCHMMTPLVLGDELSAKCKACAIPKSIKVDESCRGCPIVRQCKNCVAMNLKMTGRMESSAALRTTCAAQKALARACALLFLGRLQKSLEDGESVSDERIATGEKCFRLLADFGA